MPSLLSTVPALSSPGLTHGLTAADPCGQAGLGEGGHLWVLGGGLLVCPGAAM